MKVDSRTVATYLSTALKNQQDVISLADSKANIVLALIGVILSMFFSVFISNNEVGLMKFYLILTFFLLAGLYAFLTLYPRGNRGNKENKSILYYEEAKEMSASELFNLINGSKGEESMIKDYLTNIKALSNIASKKFKMLRLSYIFLAIGILIKLLVESTIWSS